MGSKGVGGMGLPKAMEWAVGQGRGQTVEALTVFAKYPNYEGSNTLKQLELLIQNWTDGMAEQTIAYNVHNALEARRSFTMTNYQLPTTRKRC